MDAERNSSDKRSPSDVLHSIADWLDREQSMGLWGGPRGSTEIQDSLRNIALLLAEIEHKQQSESKKMESLLEYARRLDYLLQEVADSPFRVKGKHVLVKISLDTWKKIRQTV
jgi:hypothetical protein